MTTISNLIADWGGFEELIKKMHSTGSVSVERNVKRIGLSGAQRQIDVLICHKQGLYTHEVVAECKYWNKRVSRLHVDALATTLREIGASKGAIFSSKGFQDGAIKQAAHEKIELFTVRDLTDEEWGLPGRYIDFWLRIISTGISQPRIVNPITFQGYEPDNKCINLVLSKAERSSTPINHSRRKERTLEDLIENCCIEAVTRMQLPGLFKNDHGESQGTARAITLVNMNFEKPIVTLHGGGVLVVPEISFVLGISVQQSRMKFDRSENSLFVLALENVVSQTIYAASQYKNDNFAQIHPISIKPENVSEEPLLNGSIFSVQISTPGSFDEFKNCEPGVFVFKANDFQN